MNTAWLEFVLLAALWGGSFLLIRIGVPEFGPIALIFVRVLIAALVMTPLVLLRGLGPELREKFVKTATMGVINSAIPFTLLAYSAISLSVGANSIANGSATIWTAVIGALWLGDKLKLIRWFGVGLGFVGVVMLAWDKAGVREGVSQAQVMWAIASAMLATVFYGFSANWAKRNLQGITPTVTSAGSQIGATLVLLPLALWFWPKQMPSMVSWGAAIALGVLCTGLAYVLYFRLMQNLGALRAAMVTYLVPVFGILWGWSVLGEPITGHMLVAMAVTILGTAITAGIIKRRGT